MERTLALMLLSLCSLPVARGATADEQFRRFLQTEWQHRLNRSPELAVSLGHPGYAHRWSDHSEAQIARDKARRRDALTRLQAIDRAALPDKQKLNYDLYLKNLQDAKRGERFPDEWLVLSPMGGIHTSIPTHLQRLPAKTRADYDALLEKLRGIPQVLRDNMALLKKGLARGVTPPAVTLPGLTAQMDALLEQDPAKNPVLKPFHPMPADLDPAIADKLQRQAAGILSAELLPAFRQLRDYFTGTYLPGARKTLSASSLPDGKAWYAHQVRMMTTTDLTPEAIHNIGLAEVKRIRGLMQGIMKETGFRRELPEFFRYLREDPRFYYKTREELLDAYRIAGKKADYGLVRLFGRLPRLPWGVEPIPAWKEKTDAAARYFPGNLKAGQPGIFYANTWKPEARPKWEVEVLTLHEAVPGHHLQIALAREQEDLPPFRQHSHYTAFVEGWALYAESLGKELGLYQDPWSRFGQLNFEIWRAIRLVLDTGIHSRGWTRQQAVDYFVANSASSRTNIEAEVNRYISWPAQALAYKIGQLRIKALRDRAQKEMGAGFSIRDFHDALLKEGALPLDILEKRMLTWIRGRHS